ncbi:MAG: GntR family transcriptional regulator [Rhodobacterales bacterium]|nr:GntR family transcriptional regulator [Rhodobacterales bacterium]
MTLKLKIRTLDNFQGSLTDRTVLAIREAIMELNFLPGEIIRKHDICNALGVSRSPVSEALAKLRNEGLVEVVPQSGTFVSRFSLQDIKEGAFLREAIELACIEILASNISEQQLIDLNRNLKLQKVLAESDDYQGFYQLDAKMHGMIMDFTGYKNLAKVTKTGWVQVDRARQLLLPVDGRLKKAFQEHRAVIKALEQNDVALAREKMRTHLNQLILLLTPLEKKHPHLFDNS